jgi:quinol monooxygenase YgiN
MTVIRMGEVQAKEETVDALRDFLYTIIPTIRASEGSISCQFLQNQDDPTKFVIIEVWDSVEAHQASVKNIPAEMIAEMRPLIGGGTAGAYYRILAEQ